MIQCLFLLPFLTFFSFNAVAASSPEQSLESVQKTAAKRKDFKLHFRQERYSSLLNKLQKSDGLLEYSPPRNFRWEVTAPGKELYVNNGKDFWKYTELLHHAQRLPANAADLDFLDAVLNLGSLNSRYEAEFWVPRPPSAPAKNPGNGLGTFSPTNVTNGKRTAELQATLQDGGVMSDTPPARTLGQLLVKLKPRGTAQPYSLYLAVDEKNAIVQEMRIFFQNGSRTRIVFDSLKLEKIKASEFDFAPPPGTAVDKL